MTLEEFKAWFEGFTEDLDGPPSIKQWKRIKKRVGEIDGTRLTHPVFIDRWWPYSAYWENPIWCGSTLSGGSNAMDQNVTANMLTDAGKAEFKATA